MTDREKAIVMAYTGTCMLTGDKFAIFRKYLDEKKVRTVPLPPIEDIMGVPIMTHEIGWLADAIKEKSKDDFMALCAEENNSENPNDWIPVSERLPEAGEYVGDVAKYYLVQNEYGDMMVARYTHSGHWRQMYQLEPIGDEIVAWRELPQPYKEEGEELKPKRRMYKGCENCKNYQNRICMMTGDELAMVCEEWEAKNEQG